MKEKPLQIPVFKMIGGYAAERVIHAPAAGILHNIAKGHGYCEEGQPIAWIEETDGTRTGFRQVFPVCSED